MSSKNATERAAKGIRVMVNAAREIMEAEQVFRRCRKHGALAQQRHSKTPATLRERVLAAPQASSDDEEDAE